MECYEWPVVVDRIVHFYVPLHAETLIISLTDLSCSILATNGPQVGPNRGSPAPLGPPVPNGKPTSPYGERTNPVSPNAQIAAQTVSSKDPKAAAQAASDLRNVVRRKLTGYVGFANLPNQWHRKSVRKGFNFNVMVVGKALALRMFSVNTEFERGIWFGEVDPGEYAFQHLTVPSQATKRAYFGYYSQDRFHSVNQRGH